MPQGSIKTIILQSQQLFEDPEFPADNSSLFYSKRAPFSIEWKRPGVSRILNQGISCFSVQEIIANPQLLVEDQSRFDVIQGKLGDCWLMAGAANITLKDELFYRVVPPDQSFTENYAGIYLHLYIITSINMSYCLC